MVALQADPANLTFQALLSKQQTDSRCLKRGKQLDKDFVADSSGTQLETGPPKNSIGQPGKCQGPRTSLNWREEMELVEWTKKA
jgi:hypothetical protein